MSVKVSVVVPVFDPGPHLQPCVDSLLAQTLPPGDLELIFVDDGSTDGTAEQLDLLAAGHRHVRVIHLPPSGWPGRPRNAGTAAATGEYVQFVDQDDRLGPDALRRQYELGVGSRADIVIGKVTSDFRPVPHVLFLEDRVGCTLRDAPLFESLTPHKMFRRAFLAEHGIAFPEGRRRLEDQLFVMKAYVAARSVAILASYPCYFYLRRADGGNAGDEPVDPVGYYRNLREVLDVVIAGTEPGQFRDTLLRRFYRVEMLGRLSEPLLLTYDSAYRDALLAEVRSVSAAYLTDRVPCGLPALPRLRSAFAAAGDPEGLVRLATASSEMRGDARLADLTWSEGALCVGVEAGLSSRGEPLELEECDGRLLLDPSSVLGLPGDPLDVTDESQNWRFEVIVRNRDTGVEWPAQVTATLAMQRAGDRMTARPVLTGTARLAPGRVGARDPLERGSWDIYVRVQMLGWSRRARLGHDRVPGLEEACRAALLGPGPQVVIPYFTQGAPDLTLDVGLRRRRLTSSLEGRVRVRQDLRRNLVDLDVDVVTAPDTEPLPAWLVLRGDGSHAASVSLPTRIDPADGRGHVVASLRPTASGPVAALRPGTWRCTLRVDPAGPPLSLGRLTVAPGPPLRALRALARRLRARGARLKR